MAGFFVSSLHQPRGTNRHADRSAGMKIFLLGPAGGTGKHILEQALQGGHSVRGVEREFDDGFCDHPAFEAREANILDDDLAPLMEGCDVVISALGLGRDPQTLADPPPLYTEGAVRIIEGMRKAGLKRLVVISAAFAAPRNGAPLWFRAATLPLTGIFRQMGAMERVLRAASDIEWTAVRPGWLLNRKESGHYEIGENSLPPGTLRTRRPDLARFMLECAADDRLVRRTPFIAGRESLHLETPPALIEEFLPF